MFRLIIIILGFPLSVIGQSINEEKYCLNEFLKNIGEQSDTLTVLKIPNVCVDTLPRQVYELTNLKRISIDSHTGGQVYISPDIKNLKNLESLSLIKTGIRALPAEIGELKKLKSIQINYGMNLSSLPKEIGKLENLEYLNLFRNKLTTLPKEIGNLTHLKKLVLGENNFSKEEQQKIKKLLPNCKVDFSHNGY